MGFSAVNISMNTCAAEFETAHKRSIIATCHGLWSGGAMAGSALAGMAYGFGALPSSYVFVMVTVAVVVFLLVKTPLHNLQISHATEEVATKTSKAFIRPNRALWVLIVIGLCVNLGEGSMVDWSAVYLREILDASESTASLGFSFYAFFMMSGRLLGDGLLTRYGSKSVLRTCGLLMTLGLVTVTLATNIWLVFLGYAMIGGGVSLGSPILYSTAAKVPGLPKGAGLAVYNTYAMVGFLGGPVVIGFVAKAYDLRVAFLFVALMAVVWVVAVRKIK